MHTLGGGGGGGGAPRFTAGVNGKIGSCGCLAATRSNQEVHRRVRQKRRQKKNEIKRKKKISEVVE